MGGPRYYNYSAVLAFIVQYKAEHDGNSPTIREIQAGAGLSSTSVTSYILQKLEMSGAISRPGGRGAARYIVVCHNQEG